MVSPVNPVGPGSALGGGGDAYGNNIQGLDRMGPDYGKVDPEKVHYRPAGSGIRCGTCQNGVFPPESRTGRCLIVAGEIREDFVCDQYEPILFANASKESRMSVAEAVKALSPDSLSWIEYARQFSKDQRDDMAKKGTALPDGSYPIANKGDLKNAIQAVGRAKPGDRAKVKAHIKKRAKNLGATDMIPDDWDPGAGDEGDD